MYIEGAYVGQNSSSTDQSDSTNNKLYGMNKDYIPCYIINTLNSKTIKFNCEPDEVSDSVAAVFSAQDVRGRSSQYQGYDHTNSRTISFTVTLHDDLCEKGVLNTANHLKSLSYPDYNGGLVVAPKVYIHIGDMIRAYAVITNVSVSWKKPYRNNVYVEADVSIEATEVVGTAHSYSDIWANGGYENES